MGIKKFWGWFKNRFSNSIIRMKGDEVFSDLKDDIIMEDGVIIDNLMLDMNGIFHNSAQKVYEYGAYKPMQRLMGQRRQNLGGMQKQLKFFQDVCADIDNIVNIVKPKKRLILCVDGPAPLSKQNQQRQRRFMSALEKDKDGTRSFDSNSITPGTKMMDYLTKYIDWYIRNKISSDDSNWKNMEVIFSNEKAPGEGEHKLINFIRKHGTKSESYCIYGMDADLIMLSLGTHMPKFYILREDQMDRQYKYYVIDIGTVRHELGEIMLWKNPKVEYDVENAINDFIFMCFTVGNDFLPHIPGIEIIEGGIDFMLDVYKKVGESYGHVTSTQKDRVMFNKKALEVFLGTVAQYEKSVLEDKLSHKHQFFQDPILEANAEFLEGKYVLDIEKYRETYYAENLEEIKDEKTLCHDYLEGMQWVLDYYTRGVPNWKWRFRYHYAPFAFTIAKNVNTFEFPEYVHTTPTVPFVQLLSVLPPKSSDLLPKPLDSLLTSKSSPLDKYCPDDFYIDLSGCKAEWEGVVILPMVDYDVVEKAYFKNIKSVEEKERKRNILGKSFVYARDVVTYKFASYYGDFDCKVSVNPIDL